jgi:heat shock protein HslJ
VRRGNDVGARGADLALDDPDRERPVRPNRRGGPGSYTLTLRDDGSFQAVADCNTVNGTFETSGDEITLSLGASTLVACPEGSRSDEYIDLLGSVSSFNVDGDALRLYLSNAAGRMAFTAD